MGINLQIGWDALMLAMIVVIVGGTGSIQGAFFGGLLIGLLDAFGKAYFPNFAYFAIYAALIMILLFKPSGLMGRVMKVQMTEDQLQPTPGFSLKKSLAKRATLDDASKPVWERRFYSLAPYLGIAVLLIILPPFLSSYYLGMLTKVLIFAIFAASLDLIMGYGGLFSMGHAAYLGVSGYAVGILSLRMGINLFWILLPLAIFVSLAAAAVIGYVSLRVSGVYFLLVTLAFGQLLSIVATKWFKITGGSDGLVGIMPPNLGIPGFHMGTYGFYYMVFIICTICFVLLHRIVNSSFGSALVGIRENEMRMRSLGYNTWALKYLAVIIAGGFAGVAGILYAYFYGAMVPKTLAIEMSTAVMLMVIIGGPGTLFGPFMGAVVFVLAEHFARIYVPERWPLLLGGIFIACVMLVPGGFANYLSRFWRTIRFRPE
jgi:branched-chain amino acid transport system permease protein